MTDCNYRVIFKNIILLIVMAALLATAFFPGIAYAKEAIGSRMEIEKIDGEVYIISSKGNKTAAREGVKLSSGDSLQTSKESYVYLSLDETKIVKVDELSQIKVNKSGKKLKIDLEEGELFFEVKEKLDKDESLTFSASTMAMSIRGTSGIISIRRVKNEIETRVDLLEGRVDIEYSDMKSKDKKITLWGGEEVVHIEDSQTIDRSLIDISKLDGFAAVEFKTNKSLSEKVANESGINSNRIIKIADELLLNSQKNNAEKYSDVFADNSKTSVASLKKSKKTPVTSKKATNKTGAKKQQASPSASEALPVLPVVTPTVKPIVSAPEPYYEEPVYEEPYVNEEEHHNDDSDNRQTPNEEPERNTEPEKSSEPEYIPEPTKSEEPQYIPEPTVPEVITPTPEPVKSEEKVPTPEPTKSEPLSPSPKETVVEIEIETVMPVVIETIVPIETQMPIPSEKPE